MNCRVTTVMSLPSHNRYACAALCRFDSEMQREFDGRTDCGASTTPVAVVYLGDAPTAWAATHRWREMQTLEGYTHSLHRRRGLQRFAATGLIAAGHLDIRQPVAVFSPDCVGLTRSLGFVEVKLFRRADSDWIEVSL
jgi:hypothetical protein